MGMGMGMGILHVVYGAMPKEDVTPLIQLGQTLFCSRHRWDPSSVLQDKADPSQRRDENVLPKREHLKRSACVVEPLVIVVVVRGLLVLASL